MLLEIFERVGDDLALLETYQVETPVHFDLALMDALARYGKFEWKLENTKVFLEPRNGWYDVESAHRAIQVLLRHGLVLVGSVECRTFRELLDAWRQVSDQQGFQVRLTDSGLWFQFTQTQ